MLTECTLVHPDRQKKIGYFEQCTESVGIINLSQIHHLNPTVKAIVFGWSSRTSVTVALVRDDFGEASTDLMFNGRD